MKRGILIGSLSGPNFAIRITKWTAHELNSVICVLEKKIKRKHFDQVETFFFLLSEQKILSEVLQKWCNKKQIFSSIVARVLSLIKCAVPSGIQNRATDNNKYFIELACSVCTEKILVEFFFCKFVDLACRSVHKLAKK